MLSIVVISLITHSPEEAVLLDFDKVSGESAG